MIYDYSVTTRKGEELCLSEYKGKVIMIVNTATGCGFTPQYAPIEKLYEKYPTQEDVYSFMKGFESLVSWMLYDAGVTQFSPEDFDIARP